MRARINLKNYANKIIEIAKEAQIYNTFPQLNMVYNNITVQLRQDLPAPYKEMILDTFLQELDKRKLIWFKLYEQRSTRRIIFIYNLNYSRDLMAKSSSRRIFNYNRQSNRFRTPVHFNEETINKILNIIIL